MAILLFVLSVSSFLGSVAAEHSGNTTEARYLALVAAILFSAAGIVGALNNVQEAVGEVKQAVEEVKDAVEEVKQTVEDENPI